jgi:hypothetical protein
MDVSACALATAPSADETSRIILLISTSIQRHDRWSIPSVRSFISKAAAAAGSPAYFRHRAKVMRSGWCAIPAAFAQEFMVDRARSS